MPTHISTMLIFMLRCRSWSCSDYRWAGSIPSLCCKEKYIWLKDENLPMDQGNVAFAPDAR